MVSCDEDISRLTLQLVSLPEFSSEPQSFNTKPKIVKKPSQPNVSPHIRSTNLADLTVYRPTFFMHALTSPLPLTLASLKALVEIYLERNDLRIAELEGERRPGRPKAKELIELEERRAAESKEYETGFGELVSASKGSGT